MDSELQIGLVALGVAAVVGIIAYNKWQERKHRKQAESAFRSEHRDVLLEPREQDEAMRPGHRVEPQDARLEPGVEPLARPATATPASTPSGRQNTPGAPDAIDPRIDCVIRIESIEPLDAGRLWAAQKDQLQGFNRSMRWFAFDDAGNVWRALTGHTTGQFHWFCVAMQMVSRRGAIGEADFVRFSEGVQRVADQFLAVPADVPARAAALASAAEVDRFCASVDVQVGVNIIAHQHPFAGTKVRALAEANGMMLGDDGTFHAHDEDGRTLFSLSNMEPSLFSASEMRHLHTSGLTLLIDVPLVLDGVGAFDRMMRVANQMAHSLEGSIVDDNRTSFGPESAALIRSQIQHFQARMAEAGMPAGSTLALRLFSA
ncbi:MAG: cell division protein ZipA C-terminal FtsZ-binding domain-containing protein [Rhodocyclaceae bacterium]